jgi:hypothetical protein
MKTHKHAFPLKHLMVMTATGTLDLDASKVALKSIVADPNFDEQYEVLLDLRGIECAMSTVHIYELAKYMAFPNPALPTNKKIAVLVDGNFAFDHAQFLEMCAGNRGLNLRAFESYGKADDWLNAELPDDRHHVVALVDV